MPTPAETVAAFVAEWGRSPEAMLDSFRTYFLPDTIWENVGMCTTTGADEAVALMQQFIERFGLGTIDVEMVAMAASGNHVLTERIDVMRRPDGSEIMPVRVSGTFEVVDGRIIAQRDYFDTAPFRG